MAASPNNPISQEKNRPFLRIFDAREGTKERYVDPVPFIIGRSPDVHLSLHHPSISREHARLEMINGQLCLIDNHSTSGVFLNKTRLDPDQPYPLHAGDVIQIVEHVIEFRVDTPRDIDIPTIQAEMPQKKLDAKASKEQFLLHYRYMPAGMDIHFRIIQCTPKQIFQTGDTLQLAGGGLLLPTRERLLTQDKIIEVDIHWPDGKKKRILTEIMGLMQTGSIFLLGLKLHHLPKDRHDQIISVSHRSEWHTAAPPPA